MPYLESDQIYVTRSGRICKDLPRSGLEQTEGQFLLHLFVVLVVVLEVVVADVSQLGNDRRRSGRRGDERVVSIETRTLEKENQDIEACPSVVY